MRFKMGGTKIFVMQMKDLIRIGVIIVLGIVLLVLALVLFIPGRRATTNEHEYDNPEATVALYIPGTYVSTIILNGEPVEVHVTVNENEILAITIADMEYVQRVFYPLIEPRMNDLATEILRYQSAFINPSTDYPVTTAILQQAVIDALALAINN